MQTKLSITIAALAIGLAAPEISAQEAREFQANRGQIAAIRKMSTSDYAKYYVREEIIADNVDLTCQIAKNTGSLDSLTTIRVYEMRNMDESAKMVLFDLFASIDLVALKYVCPQYSHVLPR